MSCSKEDEEWKQKQGKKKVERNQEEGGEEIAAGADVLTREGKEDGDGRTAVGEMRKNSEKFP